MPNPKRKAEHAPSPVAAEWEQSYATYLSGRAVLDGVDALAIEMETKWGCDRLRLVVSDGSREKFDRQRFKLNAAIVHGTLQDVIEQGNRMKLAWRVLDTEATAAGAKPVSLETLEMALEDGTVAVIVRSTAQAKLAQVQAQGRKMVVFTLDEIAHMLNVWDGVTKAKLQWPGARVTVTRRHVADPLDSINKRAEKLEDDSLEGI